MNPMRKIRIEKVVLNIGCGEAGEKLERAKKLLEHLVKGRKIIITKTHKRTTFGTPRGRPIGVCVTLRGKEAESFLRKALSAVDNNLSEKCFDTQGNFSFGIKEHIALPGERYDPEIGIWGMDVCVRLERPGYRILKKKISSKISKRHRITPKEAKQFMMENFGVKVE